VLFSALRHLEVLKVRFLLRNSVGFNQNTMYKTKTSVAWSLLLLLFLSAQVSGEIKKSVVLQARDARTANGMGRGSSSAYAGIFISGMIDKNSFIDFDLKVEPGKYRLVVSIVPQGGGYLIAKVDDGPSVRRLIPKSTVYSSKPKEFRFDEIEIAKDASRLRFTGENIAQPGIGYFYEVELVYVSPLPTGPQAKSPLQVLAEKEKALKQAKAAKEAQELRDNLKGTTWTFCYNHDFEGSNSTLVFGTDGNLSFMGGANHAFKVVDARTIDIFYGTSYTYNSSFGPSSVAAFSRLRFADDMGSFKSDLAEGIHQPRSGRLLQALGARSPVRKAPVPDGSAK
jgi:hypothetical protein